MNESSTSPTKQFTSSASLAAIGTKLAELKLFEPIAQTVQIAQKTIKDTPTEKLYDAFISILARAHGLVEINTRLRADVALQRAFGCRRCAEHSGGAEHVEWLYGPACGADGTSAGSHLSPAQSRLSA